MIIHSQNGFSSSPETPGRAAEECRRVHARVRQASVRSNAGDVRDLSAGGMRVVAGKAPRCGTEFQLFGMDRSFTVRGRVAWTRPTGTAFQNEIGIAFDRLSRLQREALEAFARRGHGRLL